MNFMEGFNIGIAILTFILGICFAELLWAYRVMKKEDGFSLFAWDTALKIYTNHRTTAMQFGLVAAVIIITYGFFGPGGALFGNIPNLSESSMYVPMGTEMTIYPQGRSVGIEIWFDSKGVYEIKDMKQQPLNQSQLIEFFPGWKCINGSYNGTYCDMEKIIEPGLKKWARGG